MINKLIDKIKKTNAPVVVGLDPMLSYIPQHILDKAYKEYGETLKGAAEAVFEYNKGIVDAIRLQLFLEWQRRQQVQARTVRHPSETALQEQLH